MKTLHLKAPADIPRAWKKYSAKKKTGVTLRAVRPGGESFSVYGSDSKIYADPAVDVILRNELDGKEFPCKKDIFTETYELAGPAFDDGNATVAGYRYTKKGSTILVEIPEGYCVTVHSLEGPIENVQAPTYVVIGAKDELYTNGKEFVEKNLELRRILICDNLSNSSTHKPVIIDIDQVTKLIEEGKL